MPHRCAFTNYSTAQSNLGNYPFYNDGNKASALLKKKKPDHLIFISSPPLLPSALPGLSASDCSSDSYLHQI